MLGTYGGAVALDASAKVAWTGEQKVVATIKEPATCGTDLEGDLAR